MILNNIDNLMLICLLIPIMIMSLGVIGAPFHPKLGTYMYHIGCAILAIVIIIFSVLIIMLSISQ